MTAKLTVRSLNGAILEAFQTLSLQTSANGLTKEEELLQRLCGKCNESVNIVGFATFNCVAQFMSIDSDNNLHFIILIRVFEGNMAGWDGINYTIIGHLKIHQNNSSSIDNLKLLTHIGMGYIPSNTESVYVSFYGKDVNIFTDIDQREKTAKFVYSDTKDFTFAVHEGKIGIFNGGAEDARLYVEDVDQNNVMCYVTPNTFVKYNNKLITATVCIKVNYNKTTHAFSVNELDNFVPNSTEPYKVSFKNIIATNKFDNTQWSVIKNVSLFSHNGEKYMLAWTYDKLFGIYKLGTSFNVDPPLEVTNQRDLDKFVATFGTVYGSNFGTLKLRGGSNPCKFQARQNKYIAVGHIVLEYRDPLKAYCASHATSFTCTDQQEKTDVSNYIKSTMNSILNPCINNAKCSTYYNKINRDNYFSGYFKLYMTFFYTFQFIDNKIKFCEISNFMPLPSENISEAITFPTGLSRNDNIFYVSYGVADDRTLLLEINLNDLEKMMVHIENAKMFETIFVDLNSVLMRNAGINFAKKNEISYIQNKSVYSTLKD